MKLIYHGFIGVLLIMVRSALSQGKIVHHTLLNESKFSVFYEIVLLIFRSYYIRIKFT